MSDGHTSGRVWNKPFDPSHIPEKYRNYRFDRQGGGVGSLGKLKKYDSPDGTSSIIIKKFWYFDDSKRAPLIIRELNLLRSLRHPNIVRLLGHYVVSDKGYSATPAKPDEIHSIYHITNYCGTPLDRIIHHCDTYAYKMEHVKRWMRELFGAVQYLHSLEIIHRDLHPGKMCIQDNKLTLIGFGHARAIEEQYYMTAHQGTTYYQALEMMITCKVPYNEKVDIWSASAILFELITGTVLFQGWNHAIRAMIDYCGPIGAAMLETMNHTTERAYLEKLSINATRKDFINIMRLKIASTKERSITTADVEKEEFLSDFIEKTLQFDPHSRMSATKALAHPFLNETSDGNTNSEDDDLNAYRLQILNTFSSGSSNNTQATSGSMNLDISLENMMRPSRLSKLDHEMEATFTSDFTRLCKPISVIGQGAFGCVFKVEKYIGDKLTWTRAVKRIPLQGRDFDIDVALREVMALAKLDHPGIVRFYDAWKEHPPQGWQNQHDDKLFRELHYSDYAPNKPDCAFLYIQMELCHSTLAKWLSENKERNLSKMKSWFRQIVSAVGYIHSMNYIHRDLKPTNILIAESSKMKICDLGIVADCATNNKDDGEAVLRSFEKGTKMYMAPEQMGFISKYSEKVDIFALGLILMELCVSMRIDEAAKIFNNYRSGKSNSLLNHLPEMKEVVSWLTNFIDTERPDCEEILKHAALRDLIFGASSEL